MLQPFWEAMLSSRTHCDSTRFFFNAKEDFHMSQTSAVQEVAATAAAEPKSLDVLDQLLKPEVQQSLTVLVDNLPKLAEMVTVLTKAYDFAQSVATDKVLINDFAQGIGEFVKPVHVRRKTLHPQRLKLANAHRLKQDQRSVSSVY
jgi:hypothetical protein